jgi:fimbrial chaperone protein
VVIEIPADRALGSFRLRNGRDRETAFEARAFAWTQQNGESVLTPAPEIILAPSTFVTPPNGEQIIRVGARGAMTGPNERAYRVVLRELPNPNDTSPGFRLLVEMSMPIFFTQRGARGVLYAQRSQDASGAPQIMLRNNGSARLQLSEAPESAAIVNLPRYLLPGAEAVRTYRPGALRVMAATAGDIAPNLFDLDSSHAIVLARAP